MSSSVVIKVFFGKEAHRLAFPAEKISFNDLLHKIALRIKKEPNSFSLKYEDQENDRVTLTCDDDLRDAVHVSREMNAPNLKIYVNEISDPVDKEEFVLLQSDQDVKKDLEEPPKADINANGDVSYEKLNSDLQKMLEDKLNDEREVAKGDNIKNAPEIAPCEIAPLVVDYPGDSSAPSTPGAAQVKEQKASLSAVCPAHIGVTCDGCQTTPIQGTRFKCIVCHNFDLCQECESKNVHDVQHPLLKIKVPRSCENFSPLKVGRRAPKSKRSFAKFVEDLTIPDRCNCAPGEVKTKVWKLQNVGAQDWPAGYKAVVISGEDVVDKDSREIILPAIKAGEEFQVEVKINVPKTAGRYVANFKLVNMEGEKFGPKVWVDFYVPEIEVSAKKVEEKKAEEIPKKVEELPISQKSAAEMKYQVQLDELESMGFADIGLNIYLLDKFDGKSERVVHWLLDRARSN